MAHKQDGPPGLRARLSYSNIIASLALFVALGGTAVAAVTLPRDSVGSPQIRKDAVRPPEIAKEAVRSSEIRDQGIKIADVSISAATALRGEVRVAEDKNKSTDPLPECGGLDPKVCPNYLVLRLESGGVLRTAPQQPTTTPGSPVGEPGRNWLVQAKADILDRGAVNLCALVNTAETGAKSVLDAAEVGVAHDVVSFSAVVKKRAGNPAIALRCTSNVRSLAGGPQVGAQVIALDARITALEVGTVTGP